MPSWKDTFAIIGGVHMAVQVIAVMLSFEAGYNGRPYRDALWSVPYCFAAGLGGQIRQEACS